MQLEKRRRAARVAAGQLACLQEATAALAGATVLPEIESLIAGPLAALAGAAEVGFAVAADAGGALRPLGGERRGRRTTGRSGVPLPLVEAFEHHAALWLPDRESIARRWSAAYQPGLRAVAALPLVAGGRRVGALSFQYDREQAFGPAARGLLADLARQVAVAVDRALLWEEAQRSRRAAEEASRAKDEFLAMLGHELRNPLAPIVTALHLMKLRGSGELERERAIVERQVQHVLRLVEDVLDVSRITRGKVQLDRSPVELATVVAQAVETVGPLLEQRGHRLTLEVPASGLSVDGDAVRLAQVVTNVLSNAAKYTPRQGNVRVRGWVEGGHAALAIRDDGMGIAPELLPSLFESFVQGPRSHDRSEGGLGLGLAIVKSLVALHGGTVAAASEGAGKGTEVVIRLPLARERQWSVVEGLPRITAQALPGAPVLVVDDNLDAAQTLGELLATMGCEARLAHDGPAALVAAGQRPPALVLLDLGLPVMDGYEVARRLRAMPGLAGTKIVAVTGYGQAADRERTRQAGFDGHFVKPLPVARLEALVRSLSEPARPRLAASAPA